MEEESSTMLADKLREHFNEDDQCNIECKVHVNRVDNPEYLSFLEIVFGDVSNVDVIKNQNDDQCSHCLEMVEFVAFDTNGDMLCKKCYNEILDRNTDKVANLSFDCPIHFRISHVKIYKLDNNVDPVVQFVYSKPVTIKRFLDDFSK